MLDTGLAYENRGVPPLARIRAPARQGLGLLRAHRPARDLRGRGPYPEITTATARTWPARSPRRRATASARPGSRTARRSSPSRSSTATATATSSRSPRASASPPRRGAQVINLSLRVRQRDRVGRADPADRRRDPERPPARRARSSPPPATAPPRRRHYPAALPGVLSVGAVTEHGCLADYSNTGPGGSSRPAAATTPPAGRRCHKVAARPPDHADDLTPHAHDVRPPDRLHGTSMAAPHVAATAALVIASGVLGRSPTAAAIERRSRRPRAISARPGRTRSTAPAWSTPAPPRRR